MKDLINIKLILTLLCALNFSSELFGQKVPDASRQEERSDRSNPLDQGNDVCPATVISSLPYTDTGTTSGRANNYSGSCGVGASAPDVIYQYTAAATGTYRVSLCGSSFDTGLYIRYGGSCPGSTELACNDDNGPACSGGTESSIDANLNAGTTYYIVVDGYSNYSGNYTLNVTGPRPCSSCTPEDVYFTVASTPWAGSVTGNCGNGQKWVGRFNATSGYVYHFDLCPDTPGSGTANFDVDIKICNSSCAILAGEDGNCQALSYRPNDFQWTAPASGPYYVILAPWSSYNQHNCSGTSANTFTMYYYGCQPLGTPSLNSPNNGASVCQGVSQCFICGSVSGATSYRFQFDDNSDFSSPVHEYSNGNNTTYCWAPTVISTIYWRARAEGNCNGPWSPPRSVTSYAQVGIPTLNAPSTVCSGVSYDFSWSPVPGASIYYWEGDNNSSFSSPVQCQNSNPSCPVTLSGSGTWYWHARAGNSGCTGLWSPTGSFTLRTTPGSVALSQPSNGIAFCSGAGQSYDWNPATDAQRYRIWWDDNPSFTSPEEVVVNNPPYWKVLYGSGTWYWKVRAENDCAVGTWSSNRTVILIPAPTLDQPPDGQTITSGATVYYCWIDIPAASSYRIQFDDDVNFGSPVDIPVPESDNCYPYALGGDDQDYWWRVRANTCEWSIPRRVHIQLPPAPPTVEITAPADGANVSGDVAINVLGYNYLNLALNRVEYYIDDVLRYTDNSPRRDPQPSSTWTWQTIPDYPNGDHVIRVRGYDHLGNHTDDSHNVHLLNPVAPTVYIIHPVDNETLQGTYTVTVYGRDYLNQALDRIEYRVDNTLVHTDDNPGSGNPASQWSWNTLTYSNGSHVVSVVGYDHGNRSASDQVDVSVQNSVINMSVNPAQMSFDDVPVGQSEARTLTVSNDISSTGPLGITAGVDLQQPFMITPAGSFELLPGESRLYTVRFDPNEMGVFSQTLSIDNNSTNMPHPTGVQLSGTGIDYGPSGLVKMIGVIQNAHDDPTADAGMTLVCKPLTTNNIIHAELWWYLNDIPIFGLPQGLTPLSNGYFAISVTHSIPGIPFTDGDYIHWNIRIRDDENNWFFYPPISTPQTFEATRICSYAQLNSNVQIDNGVQGFVRPEIISNDVVQINNNKAVYLSFSQYGSLSYDGDFLADYLHVLSAKSLPFEFFAPPYVTFAGVTSLPDNVQVTIHFSKWGQFGEAFANTLLDIVFNGAGINDDFDSNQKARVISTVYELVWHVIADAFGDPNFQNLTTDQQILTLLSLIADDVAESPVSWAMDITSALEGVIGQSAAHIVAEKVVNFLIPISNLANAIGWVNAAVSVGDLGLPPYPEDIVTIKKGRGHFIELTPLELPGVTELNPLPVGTNADLAFRLTNVSNQRLYNVWLGCDIYAWNNESNAYVKVENTRTDYPDPETGYIGIIDFGNAQGQDLDPAEEAVYFSDDYEFLTSVTMFNYHSSNMPYKYVFTAWSNGQPGEPLPANPRNLTRDLISVPFYMSDNTAPNTPTLYDLPAMETDESVQIYWQLNPSDADVKLVRVNIDGTFTGSIEVKMCRSVMIIKADSPQHIRIKAVDVGGMESNWSNELIVVSQPETPPPVSDLTVLVVGASIQLNWTAVTGATQYYVYAGDDPEFVPDQDHFLVSTASNTFVHNNITQAADKKFYIVTAVAE